MVRVENLRNEAVAVSPARLAAESAAALASGGTTFDLYSLYTHQERQEVLLRFFRQMGLHSLCGMRILDVGCGSGGHLRRMVDFGAEPANCFGIEPSTKCIEAARKLNPNMTFIEGSADRLAFADEKFDFVFQFTVFTSVLDLGIRHGIIGEIQRVLRRGGHFIWYDFAFSNPRNQNVRGINKREVTELLSGFHLTFKRVTLAPPVGRPAVKVFPGLYWMLRTIPLLRSHYFCFARKP